jgi:hypothetical protein
MIPTQRPRILVAFSLIALLVATFIGFIAYADQHERLKDPVHYAEKRCTASFSDTKPTAQQLDTCITKEENKSTLASILPLFVVGVIVMLIAIVGLVVGRKEVKLEDERMRRLRGEI